MALFSFQFFKKNLLEIFCRKISFKNVLFLCQKLSVEKLTVEKITVENFLFLCPKLSVKNFICPKCVENLLLKREVAKCSRPALLYWQLVLTEKKHQDTLRIIKTFDNKPESGNTDTLVSQVWKGMMKQLETHTIESGRSKKGIERKISSDQKSWQ